MTKLGINGFGRIGRVILRACLQKPDLEITSINDPAIDVQYICYLIKFDSTHGKFTGTITHTKDEILVNGKPIKIFHEKLPSKIPWHTAGVQYVIEASGMFTTMEKASGHLASETVRRVILTAPSIDVPMLILGVNDDKFNSCQKVISCASSTLYCLAPIVKVLDDSFGLAEGFVTSIHAMTPSLKPLDGLCLRGKHWRDHRSIHQNMIPAMTGACKALGKIMPRVKDKLCGLAFRVPIVNVSVLDLTIRLKSSTSLQEIIENVEKASNTELKNIIRISNESAVSSDFIGETHSCILDVDSSLQLRSYFFKLVCWYENEYSYACRVIDTIVFFESKTCSLISPIERQDSVQQREQSRKEIVSTSQDIDKYKCPQLILQKPVSNQLSSYTRSLTDNDEKHSFKPGICQNRNSAFQSCIALTPLNLEQMSAVKAQDRLEMLKKEFSKMVNVTESLLKKSYISNFCVKSNKKSINGNLEKNADRSLGKRYERKSDVCSMTQSNNLNVDCNSDIRSSVDKSLSSESKHKNINVTSPQCDIKEKVKCNSEQAKVELVTNKTEVSAIPKNAGLYGQSTHVAEMNLFTPNTLPSNTIVIKNVQETPKNCAANTNKDNLVREEKQKDIESKHLCVSIIESHNTIPISKNVIAEVNYKLRCNISESNVQNAVKLDGDKLKYNEKVKAINETEPVINAKDTSTDGRVVLNCGDNTDLPSLLDEDDVWNKRLINLDRISTRRYSFISRPSCGSPCSTSLTVSNYDTKFKEDIYDKLDSISGTDSNNSFQIHERKSQVIEFNDLTTSLEDLTRLNKICKIIEISDELSNELFSPLDSYEGTKIRNKAWSFKDLCERIKLDEFCENLFNKPSS